MKQDGFTLLELIFTVFIAAIVMTLGVPAFQETIRENRLATQANSLVTALNLARSEAVRRGTSVTLCKTADPNATPTPACLVSTTQGYESGWIVFVDADGDNVVDAGEAVIRVFQGLPGMTVLGGGPATFNNRIIYNPDGSARTAGTLTVCIPGGDERTITINLVGRARLNVTDPPVTCT